MLWTIVVGAGIGSRLGGTPKQFRDLAGTSVIVRAVRAVATASDAVVVVADPVLAADAGVEVGKDGVVAVVPGGAERSDSVAAGLTVVPSDVDVVAVHDAARPLASPALLRRCAEALGDGVDAAVPALPVVDTVKEVDDGGVVVRTLDRDRLVTVQTPQVFRASVLRAAHAVADTGATDDAALVETIGATVVVVAGEPGNVKLTMAEDFVLAGRTLGDA
ncbi:MAG: 2-C-methyl-D-erythritol 4-phosphate cytidylyltransferase [Acidimicrobiia bacterium]